ncbi:MAG: LamG-like jellyroll fold domain-containing protein [bacterium]
MLRFVLKTILVVSVVYAGQAQSIGLNLDDPNHNFVDVPLAQIQYQPQNKKLYMRSLKGNMDCGTPDSISNQLHIELDGKTYLTSGSIVYDPAAGTIDVASTLGNRSCSISGLSSLSLNIDHEPSLDLSAGVIYQLPVEDHGGTTPGILTTRVADPVLCVDFGAPQNKIIWQIIDPNSQLTDLNGPVAIDYDPTSMEMSIQSDNLVTCFTNGSGGVKALNGTGSDLVFRDNFDDIPDIGIDLEATLTASEPAVIGRDFHYQLTVRNNSQQAANNVKVRDFFPSNPSNFSAILTNGSWDCSASTGSSCNPVSGIGNVIMDGVTIGANSSLTIDITRAVDIGSSGSISMNAAVFAAPSDVDLSPLNNIALLVRTVTSNVAPTITTVANQNILEDQASDLLSFTVDDLETAPAALTVTATSSNQSIIADAGISLGGVGANRTIEVTPLADANGTAVITINVSDGTDTTQETFVVDITAVNDAPELNIPADILHPSGTTFGLYQQSAWVSVANFGAVNESGQSVQTYSLTVDSDPNGILFGLPSLDNQGDLSYGLNDAGNGLAKSGTATIIITVTDDGGTDNGGVATSQQVISHISVASNPPTISDLSNLVITDFDEDGVSQAVSFSIMDTDNSIAELSLSMSSSDTAIVANTSFDIGTVCSPVSGGADCTIQISAEPEANGGPVSVSFTVSDGAGQASTTPGSFNVLAVNDAPSFTSMGDVEAGIADTGAQVIADWVQSTDMGPDDEDAGQTVSAWEFRFLDSNDSGIDPNGILTGLPTITNTSTDLHYTLSGAIGATTIEVRMLDDGGAANGGVDASPWINFTIEVLPCTTPPANLVAWWGFDGSFTERMSGLGVDTSTLPVPGFSDGTIGQAVQFNGVDNQFSLLDDDALELGADGYSISFWLKTTDTSTVLIDKIDPANNMGYRLRLTADGKLEYYANDGVAVRASWNVVTNTVIADNEWHHVTVIGDWGSSRLNMDLYIDGSLDNTGSLITSVADLSNGADVEVGESSFSGEIDELMFFNAPISPADISILSQGATRGYCFTDVSVSMVDDADPATVNTDVTWTMTVDNVGSVDATQVLVDVTLDSTASFVSSTCPNQVQQMGQVIQCDLGTVSAGATPVSFDVVATATTVQQITTTASVSTPLGESNLFNNITSETTTIDP